MLIGTAKSIFRGGPAGPAGATLASALQDVVAAIKAVLTAPDLPSARAALGLGNVANLAPADYPVSTAQAAAIAAAIAGLVSSSPAALDTLKELADALGDDPNFATTVATQLGLKAPAARIIVAGTGLAGGGDLSADRTLALAAVATGMVLANTSGAPAAPVPTTLSALLDAVVGTARGGLLVRGASGWGPLALGASGTTLQSNGTDAVFAAASPGTGALRYDVAQSLAAGQQDQVRANVLGGVPLTPGDGQTATLTVLDTHKPVSGTGAFTVVAANGGVGWISGEISNDNAVAGLGTLKVPTGATLDGVTDGTQLVFPGQVARLRQVGASAYRVRWVVQRPILRRYAYSGSIASWDFVLPAGYQRFRLVGSRILPGTHGGQLIGYLSFDGGSTFKSGSSDYTYTFVLGNNGGVSGSGSSVGFIPITASLYGTNSVIKASTEFVLDPGDGNERTNYTAMSNDVNSANSYQENLSYTGQCAALTTRPNALRLGWSNGATQGSGQFTLIGEA